MSLYIQHWLLFFSNVTRIKMSPLKPEIKDTLNFQDCASYMHSHFAHKREVHSEWYLLTVEFSPSVCHSLEHCPMDVTNVCWLIRGLQHVSYRTTMTPNPNTKVSRLIKNSYFTVSKLHMWKQKEKESSCWPENPAAFLDVKCGKRAVPKYRFTLNKLGCSLTDF